VLRPHIFTRARDWRRFSSAHPKRDGGHPKKFNRENLKFGLKFSVCATITSGLVGVSSQNFYRVTCREAGMIKWVQLWKARPLNFGTAKKRPEIGAISDNFRLWSLISLERIESIDIFANQKTDWSTTTPSTLGEKYLWTLVHKQKSSRGSYIDQYKWTFFWRLHFGHSGVLLLRFLHALEIDLGYLAHPLPHWGRPDGGPPEKNGLKFCVWTPITITILLWRPVAVRWELLTAVCSFTFYLYTSTLVPGISSTNFSRRRDELWSTNKKVIAHTDTPEVLVH